MKSRKVSGPTGVVFKMLRAGGKGCFKSLIMVFNEVLFENKLPDKFMLSSMVAVYREKTTP